jgi:glutamyl-tRNA reductase
MSHRTAGVRALERAAVHPDELSKVLDELLHADGVSEVMLLSTCNRVEVYSVVETFHGGLADITGVLARHAGAEAADLMDHLYVHYASAAAQHLFSVASGLDSMVVGEAQILGQVRGAYAVASEAGTVGRTLHEVVQNALRVGKRVHADTDIDHTGASVVSEALGDAARVLGDLTGRRALLVGAGSMGGLAAAHLRRAGIGAITVANRTEANGQRLVDALLADGVPAEAATLSDLPARIAEADLVLACTGSADVLVTEPVVRAALDQRNPARPLAVCDLGLPRDVDAGVAELPGVSVVDLSTLQQRLLRAPEGDTTSVAAQIVADEVKEYLATQRSAEVTPTVTALRARAAEVVTDELMRLETRLPGLDDAARGEVAKTVRRVVDKLLHTPTVRVKELAAGPEGASYADALRELFALDPQTPAVVASVREAQAGSPGGPLAGEGE